MATAITICLSIFVVFMAFGNMKTFVVSEPTYKTGPVCDPPRPLNSIPIHPIDVILLQFPLNLEYLEAEFFLQSTTGNGLDGIAPELARGGPPPIGAMKANLDDLTWDIIFQFGLQEVGHIRAIQETVGGFSRPLLDLSASNFANIMNQAFGYTLDPPFDPYANSINHMMASYVIPYVGLVGYVGTNPLLIGYKSKELLVGLLGVESGQDAVLRTYLYERKDMIVYPYNYTVAEFTNRISDLRNRLAMCGIKDEGLVVPRELGAEGRVSGNILFADEDSLSYARTPEEILKIVYGTGDEHIPGGFYPEGANGTIARSFLKMP